MDKLSLVYEFNKESPLLSYQASKELEIQNYAKALSLLNSAIEKYPHHATPDSLKSLALAYNNNFDDARNFLDLGHEILGVDSTFKYYSDQIIKIKKESEGILFDFDDTVQDVLNESFLEPEDFDPLNDLELIDEDFKDITPVETQSFEENSIVTETLAEIYASQSNFDEAIEIYEKLIELKPDLTEKFNNRITELNQAIENKRQKKFGNKK